ncbi:MAG: hypothetical protein M1835_003341, partial [Candelina submexicana]
HADDNAAHVHTHVRDSGSSHDDGPGRARKKQKKKKKKKKKKKDSSRTLCPAGGGGGFRADLGSLVRRRLRREGWGRRGGGIGGLVRVGVGVVVSAVSTLRVVVVVVVGADCVEEVEV